MAQLTNRTRRSFTASLALLGTSATLISTLPGCAATPAIDFDAVLASPLRPVDDRKADARRMPADLLRLSLVRPGMSVLDISAGGGYTTQVFSVAVGATGKVWAQAPKPGPALLARAKATPSAIEVLARPFDDPFPAGAPRVDLVTLVLSYHDIVNTPTDRMKMNRAMFDALKPGGRLVIMDHSGRPGTGLTETQTLHRIDEAALRREVEAAGFLFEADGAAWRNPADTRASHYREAKPSSDKFALRFARPR